MCRLDLGVGLWGRLAAGTARKLDPPLGGPVALPGVRKSRLPPQPQRSQAPHRPAAVDLCVGLVTFI